MTVKVEEKHTPNPDQLLLVEPAPDIAENSKVCLGDTQVKLTPDGRARVHQANFTSFTRKLQKGSWIGNATETAVMEEVLQKFPWKSLKSPHHLLQYKL